MNKQRLGDMTDDLLDRDIARALAVDPSPEFLARVRARVAEETAPPVWRIPWRMLCFAGGPILAAAILAAAYVVRSRPVDAPVVSSVLAGRPIEGTASVPYVTPRASRVSARPEPVDQPSRLALRRSAAASAEAEARALTPLLDPRETAALRSLIAGVRSNRVDLTPLLQPAGPAPMELPPVDDLVIAPIAIEPLAPQSGAQGERQ